MQQDTEWFVRSAAAERLLRLWGQSGLCAPVTLLAEPEGGGAGALELARALAGQRQRCGNADTAPRRCFLALRYPCGGSGDERDKFYESPTVYAEICNRYTGTFCIDLQAWRDSWRTPEARRLCNFIRAERRTMGFVLLLRGRAACAALAAVLQDTGCECLDLGYLPPARYGGYLRAQLAGAGCRVQPQAEAPLQKLLTELCAQDSFSGLYTLDTLVRELEYAAAEPARADSAEKAIGEAELAAVREKMRGGGAGGERRIGF